MVFVFNNFLTMTSNLFTSSGFAGIVLNGFPSSGGDLQSAVAPFNVRRFLTHNKSVAKSTLVEFDVVPVGVVVGGNVAAVIGGKVMAVMGGNVSGWSVVHVGFKGGAPINFVSIEGKVPLQAGGHEIVVKGNGVTVSVLLGLGLGSTCLTSLATDSLGDSHFLT